MDANFAIGPLNWQLELDQGVTEFYDQIITEFYVNANFAIGPIV